MFIQTEPTPNPATLKFMPGVEVMESGTADFASAESAAGTPLALRLLEIEPVVRVFYGADFVSVTQTGADWQDVKSEVLGVIMEHFTAGLPLFEEGAAPAPDGAGGSGAEAGEPGESGGDSEVVIQIKELLDTRVRPAVAQDGGDIIFDHFDNGIVYLHMQGACAGCPSSTATLQYGIENMLKHYIPEVTEVRPI